MIDFKTIRQYNFPTVIRFGAHAIDELPDHLLSVGVKKPLLVTDSTIIQLEFFRNILAALGEKKISAEVFSCLCFVYGFLFDWIMNLWHVLGFIKPLNIKTIAAAYLSGLTFDIMHAASSFIFCIIFYDSFLKVLKRFKRRLEVSYIK